uniref:Cytochrome P450 CYP3026A2 n=1 Tax=Tigriopus japonicus TaxID=158387 RepID=A0A088DJV9_TIGJA|nr:cytochrome P450 CYP3026A2 [Tigriopus japonicus]
MILECFVGVLCFVLYYYFKFRRAWHFWKQQNVEYVKPVFPFGSSPVMNWSMVLNPTTNFNQGAYEQAKALGFPKFFGLYIFANPVMAICDPEMAKQIMVKDFDHFVDRQGDAAVEFLRTSHFVDKLWLQQLPSLQGEEWKKSRNTFTPIFTAGKLKGMMQFIHEVTKNLVKSIGQEVALDQPFDLKVKYSKFSMDTIASCAFGVNAKSFEDKNSKFAKNAREFFRNTPKDMWKVLIAAIVPGGKFVMEKLSIPIQKYEQTMFFYEIVKETVNHRMQTKFRRNDLVDLMIDAMKEDSESDTNPNQIHDNARKSLDEITLVATALVILIAGYDTTAQTLAITSFYLARNPDIQDKLYQEIVDVSGELDVDSYPDYNLIQSLPYMDMVLHETLRINPALGLITRACTKDYIVPGTSIPLKRGDDVHIYVSAIHKNREIYPDPDQYDPERFSAQAKANRHPYAFLGFGHGPRACIGMRFALLEAKLALFGVLRSYKFVTCADTVESFTLEPSAMLAAPKEPLLVKVEARLK